MPLASPTQTRIYNRALALLGSSDRVSNFDDATPSAEALSEHWPTAVRSLMAEHPWNFAIARETLNKGAAPAFGEGYTYALPADCLRWLPWSKDSEHYAEAVQEGGALLADAGESLNIRYIALIEDVAAWPAHFVDCMGYRLAMDAAEAVHSISSNVADLERKFDMALIKAKRADGLATGDRERGDAVTHSRALSAAYGGDHTYWVPGVGYRH